MATMTPQQAAASLLSAARDAEQINRDELRRIAAAAIPVIESSWPVATGRSQDGWTTQPTATGAAVVNPVPYASDVHDGLAARLVPEVLADLEDQWTLAVERRLTPTLSGR